MIDDSDYCVFYYDEQYRSAIRFATYQQCYLQKREAQLAYWYAKQKKKDVINIL